MDSNQDTSSDISTRQRKFGLPNWMVNNIDRLNFATDFEQYGCSPPENEGFLTEYMENSEASKSRLICDDLDAPADIRHKENGLAGNPTEINHSSHVLPTRGHLQPYHPLLESIRHEDLYSSPDSTPCATPEPSPVIRRKLSIPHPQDTVQTNPGRWFYMGKLRKNVPNCVLPLSNNKENNTGRIDSSVTKHTDLKAKKSAIKLVISNFDLNAVSPNSW